MPAKKRPRSFLVLPLGQHWTIHSGGGWGLHISPVVSATSYATSSQNGSYNFLCTAKTKVYPKPHSLPHIERELNRLLDKTNQDLDGLPLPPSSTPLGDVIRLVTDFTGDVKKQGEGEPGRGHLLQQLRGPQDEFRVAVRETAPCFIPQYSKPQLRPASLRDDMDAVSPVFPILARTCDRL
jgi:hypothetical protein